MPLTPPDDEVERVSDEQLAVLRNRYDAARAAGLSIAEAELFRDGDYRTCDVGRLRRAVKDRCPEELRREIFL